ncbi:MAG: hypothetical protein JW855_06060 [Gammaproteobacteria bacterium]|nr:hypothetical protein [Gammaproteobacteria bacterium]
MCFIHENSENKKTRETCEKAESVQYQISILLSVRDITGREREIMRMIKDIKASKPFKRMKTYGSTFVDFEDKEGKLQIFFSTPRALQDGRFGEDVSKISELTASELCNSKISESILALPSAVVENLNENVSQIEGASSDDPWLKIKKRHTVVPITSKFIEFLHAVFIENADTNKDTINELLLNAIMDADKDIPSRRIPVVIKKGEEVEEKKEEEVEEKKEEEVEERKPLFRK